MNIYVGNLSHQVKAEELEELFKEYGAVRLLKLSVICLLENQKDLHC